MVFGITTEQYESPKSVPIDITILRGARRLQFSSPLLPLYRDFGPKLWKIVSDLGYKKFLQRIYISIPVYHKIRSTELEFPILLATIEALHIAQYQTAITCIGHCISNSQITSSLDSTRLGSNWTGNLYTITQKQHITRILASLYKPLPEIRETTDWKYIFTSLFPGCLLTNLGQLDISETPFSTLKKIPLSEFEYLPLFLDIHKKMGKTKIEFIQVLPIKNIVISDKKCPHKGNTCPCNDQLSLLKTNAWRIEVPFVPS